MKSKSGDCPKAQQLTNGSLCEISTSRDRQTLKARRPDAHLHHNPSHPTVSDRRRPLAAQTLKQAQAQRIPARNFSAFFSRFSLTPVPGLVDQDENTPLSATLCKRDSLTITNLFAIPACHVPVAGSINWRQKAKEPANRNCGQVAFGRRREKRPGLARTKKRHDQPKGAHCVGRKGKVFDYWR